MLILSGRITILFVTIYQKNNKTLVNLQIINCSFAMKKNCVLSLLVSFCSLITIFSCEDMDDNPIPGESQVKDFIWKGLNTYYLWQGDVTDLGDNRFDSNADYVAYLSSFSTPEALFEDLKVDSSIDRFSRIFSDYNVLQGVLTGNTLNNGVDFGLRYKSGTSGEVYGWVRYIIPNSDASTKNIQRGDIFYAVNGNQLYFNSPSDNNLSLLNATTYTLSLANFNGGAITPNGENVSLTKTPLSEFPILANTVFTQGNHTIGYLMYNAFYAAYDNQLNEAFGNFAAQNVTDLVLDLRYNSGGSVKSAVKLASMITGQFTDQVFLNEQWNAKAQSFFQNTNPTRLQEKFIGGLNSLNLSKVYIITSKSTASASELVINCLKPYIDVIQIGDVTSGKNVASITLYDSPTYGFSDVNPTHRYAMQPIVLKTTNKIGFGDYTSGLVPELSLQIQENIGNLGVLSDPTEPLLNLAINRITASGKRIHVPLNDNARDFMDSKSLRVFGNEMYTTAK
jgi:carboxyl-terminal processing protease